MKSGDILRLYAIFYVNENDDFNFSKKIDMLNLIHHATDSKILDLFEQGEIKSPHVLKDIDTFDKLMEEADFFIELSLAIPGLPGISMDDVMGSLKKMKNVKQLLIKKYQDADQSIKDAIKKKINMANDKIDMLQHKVSGAPKPKKGFEKAVEGGKEIVQQAKDKAGEVGEKVGKAIGKAAEYAQSNTGTTVAVAVAAAAALTAGALAYRRFISKSGKACKDAADKNACKREYHNKGLQAQMTALSAGKAKCFKTKNPDKCKAKIDVKIAQVKNKMKR